MKRPFVLPTLILSLAAFIAVAPGCDRQGEGERCSELNGNEDCSGSLVCRQGARLNVSVCCPESGFNDPRCNPAIGVSGASGAGGTGGTNGGTSGAAGTAAGSAGTSTGGTAGAAGTGGTAGTAGTTGGTMTGGSAGSGGASSSSSGGTGGTM